MRRTFLPALAALSLLLSAACSDDEPEAGEPTTTTDAPTTTTTEAPTTTTTGPTTTTAGPLGSPCPDVSIPASAEEITEVSADVDGDGHDDVLRTYRDGDEWTLQAEVAATGGSQLSIESFGGAVGVVGGSDIDGDGTDEVWARVGSGASAVIMAVADFEDCTLAWVTRADGARAEMPVGGSVGTTSGVECDASIDPEADLTTYTAVLVGEGPDYEVTAVEHTLDGSTLVEGASDDAVVSALESEFDRYTSFSCADLSL